MIPGEYFLKADDIIANAGRKTIKISVVNTGDRPVQIGSHCHFFEVNKQMKFPREAALGMRLNIPSGNAVRFEPGEEKEVELVELGGNRKVIGINNLVNGDTTDPIVRTAALEKAALLNFKSTDL
ncbi:urease subunit beta [Chitinophaga terrae (ex Kim and Jung 2007)]|uniref:Urease subunit beta n=1 Tax=Chitinophaga terrae (ex Kim and Jung 2007) TaxID=408074 RepID=A0A1H4F289_9BACT|nr:urease subunit beta [Chitinophaga terrae (ex Kim and Jung 2007)]GEP92055.1 urease subunit beta [Chitinophaga terrae (ex Kim and Jung 2007)]SEA91485.1 urease subunit beta [Chitinophaga terrae (ex Kim and Jung 2007)]